MNSAALAAQVSAILDEFEKENGVGPEHSRLVYAILLGQVFKRYCSRFGMKSARIILRNLYGALYRAELNQDAATKSQINRAAGKPPKT